MNFLKLIKEERIIKQLLMIKNYLEKEIMTLFIIKREMKKNKNKKFVKKGPTLNV